MEEKTVSTTENEIVPTEEAVKEAPAPEVAEAPSENEPGGIPVTFGAPEQITPVRKKSKKGIVISIVALILVAAIVAGIFFFKGRPSGPAYTMYIKDNALYYTELDEISPIKISNELFDEDDTDASFADIIFSALGLSGTVVESSVKLLSDGKTLIYPQKISASYDAMNVFIKDIKAENAQEVKIDSDISNYLLTSDEKTVIYFKADGDCYDAYLYTLSTKEKEKIIDNMKTYQASADCTKILYQNEDAGLYVYSIFADGEKKEKIDGEVKSVFYNNDDFSVIRYIKKDEIFEKKGAEKPKKLADEVDTVITSYESGEIYFLKLEKESIPYSALFTDDMKEKDEGITVEKAKSIYDKSGWSEYEAYWIKNYNTLERDSLRRLVEGRSIERKIYSLHCVSEDGEKKIADNLSADQFGFSYTFAADKPLVVFNTIDEAAMRKFKISELKQGEASYNDRTDEWEYTVPDAEIFTLFREAVEQNYYDANKLKMAVGETVTDIDEDRANDITVAPDASAVYYIDNIEFEKEEVREDRDFDEEWSRDVYYFEDTDDDGQKELFLNHEDWKETLDHDLSGEAFKIEITDGKASGSTLVDSDVSLYGIRLESDKESLTYFKNYDSETNVGDYYLNGTEIAYDVKGSSVTFYSPEEIYYLTDYDDEDKVGELRKYDGEEHATVASEVYSFEKLTSGDIVFITEYSTKSENGNLYLVGKKENVLIDYDVTSVVSSLNLRQRLNVISNKFSDFEFELDFENATKTTEKSSDESV